MGKILQKAGWRRSSYVVSSKVFFGAEGDRPNEDGLCAQHVIESLPRGPPAVSRWTIWTCISAIALTPLCDRRNGPCDA